MSCGAVNNSTAASSIANCNEGAPIQADSVGSREALLPLPFAELAGSGDLGAQIAALIVKAAREQKVAAHATRATAEKAQRAADDKELADMKEASDARFTAGLIAGGTQVASGALSMGGNSYGQAAGKMTEGAGKAVGSYYEKDAEMANVEAKKDQQASGRAKTAIDDARDMDKDAKEMLNRALSYYKEYLTAKSDTMRATLLRA